MVLFYIFTLLLSILGNKINLSLINAKNCNFELKNIYFRKYLMTLLITIDNETSSKKERKKEQKMSYID